MLSGQQITDRVAKTVQRRYAEPILSSIEFGRDRIKCCFKIRSIKIWHVFVGVERKQVRKTLRFLSRETGTHGSAVKPAQNRRDGTDLGSEEKSYLLEAVFSLRCP